MCHHRVVVLCNIGSVLVFCVAVMSAIADWMGGRYRTCVFQLVAAAVWFRCDMVLLLGTIGITLLLTRKVGLCLLHPPTCD